jgi:hypothetical protein
MPNLQPVKNVAYLFLQIVLLCCSSVVYGQLGGRGVYQFLDVVSSPRVTGLGGKAVAFDEEDLNFALWNPSLLRKEMHGQLGLNHISYSTDISTGEASYAYHWEGVGTFQAGFRYFDYGQFEAANFQGIQQGVFTAADYAFLLAGARQIDSNWSVGVQTKVINSVLETYTSWGLAADLGITYRIPKQRLAFSVLLRNMGGQTETYAGIQEQLPFEIQFGISNKFEHMPFRWQITFEHLQQWDVGYENPNGAQTDPLTGEALDQELNFGQMLLRHMVVGAEFQPVKSFHFQVGYSFRRRAEMRMLTRRSSAGLSFGFGLRIFKVYINYARSIQHVAGSNNHFSLTTDLGNFNKK